MAIKNKRKPKKCSVCMSPLEDQSLRLGCCAGCVARAIQKLRRRMAVGAVVGAALAAAYGLFVWYARAFHVLSETVGYPGDILLPTFFGYLTFSARFLGGMMYRALPGHLLAAAILFLLPFGVFIRLENHTFRHKAQEHVARLDPFAGNMIAGTQYHRLDDIGLFALSALLFLATGPVGFAYRLCRLGQLSRHRAAGR